MVPPFDRARLRERNALDEAEDRTDAARRTPAERVAASLSLSHLVRELSRAAGTAERADEHDGLAEKAYLYVVPLRVLQVRG